MSYNEYKEVVQFALDRLNLKKTFDILIYDTSTFIDVMSYYHFLISLNPKTKQKAKARNIEEYGIPQLQVGQVDCYFLTERTKNPKIKKLCIKNTKELIKEGICTEEHLESLEKFFSNDFLIIINRNMIDCYAKKESKFICVVHEVLHLAQEVGSLSQNLSTREIDNLAKPIVSDFLSKNESFMG